MIRKYRRESCIFCDRLIAALRFSRLYSTQIYLSSEGSPCPSLRQDANWFPFRGPSPTPSDGLQHLHVGFDQDSVTSMSTSSGCRKSSRHRKSLHNSMAAVASLRTGGGATLTTDRRVVEQSQIPFPRKLEILRSIYPLVSQVIRASLTRF
jgi:hypothetical protein